MAPKTPISPGRPPIEIDWQALDEDLQAGCSGQAVADKLGIHRETLYNKIKDKFGVDFSVYSTWKAQKGDDLLLRAQFDKAIGLTKKGDTTLLTFLGRVRLKQKEVVDENISTVPNEDFLKLQHELLEAKYELEKLKNAIQSKTAAELQRVDSTI